jgi:hypothetical protein
MKTLRQTILTLAVVAGMAFGVAAQGDDQKKPPKNPPVVDPGKKPPRGNPPKDDKPKPGSAYYLV